MTRVLFNLLIATLVILPMLTFANKPYLLSLDLLEDAERIAYDIRLRDSIKKRSIEGKDELIAIVNLDQDTLAEHGNWPWRRDKVATLLKNLVDVYQAKLVILPESFMNRGDQGVGIIRDLRDRFYYDNAVLTALDQLELDFNFDRQLLNEIDGRPVILGFEFLQAERREGRLPIPSDIEESGTNEIMSSSESRRFTSAWRDYRGFSSSDQEFVDLALSAGFTNYLLDDDGTIRSHDLGGLYAGDRYFSLAAESLRRIDNPRRPVNLTGRPHDGLTYLASKAFAWFGVQQHEVSVNREGAMLLRFYSPGKENESYFPYYSANDIMANNQLNVSLEGKVVFVGSDSEAINDFWRTPVDSRMPGVEIHATALRNLLDGTLVRNHNAWLHEAGLLILLSILISYIYPRFALILNLLITALGVFAVYYVNYEYFWLQQGEVYRIVPFFLLFVAMMFTNLITGFLVEYRAKKKVQGVLNQYIPPELAKEVDASKKGFSMEGEIRDMSILFSDVRGFTSISERFEPSELTKFMNEMLSSLSREIHHNRGTIDKYIGDAVMAFWNAPLDEPKHASYAVRGAMGMQKAMRKLSAKLVQKGLPELKMGVGINSGEACVGNMGSEIRLSYTVMGDTVNLASRLEGITKQYGVDIIVGEHTYELSKNDFIYRPVDAVRVKGKEQAVVIYEPLSDLQSATADLHHLQEESLSYWQAYCERRFDDMAEILRRNLKEYPDDGLMQLYMQRAIKYIETPPSDDWEPVTNFETK